MKTKILLFILIVSIFISLVVTTTGCTKNQNDTNSVTTEKETSSLPKKTIAELDSMYEKACEYEKNAKFKSAIILFRELRKYDYYDKDFGSYGLDEALETRESRYLCESIAVQFVSSAIRTLKNQLKDPNSLVIYSIWFSEDNGLMVLKFDYGAKNSFGGMVRDSYTWKSSWGLSEEQKQKVYSAHKDFMDSRGYTKEDAMAIVAGNHHIGYESQYAAIVAGTYDY